jgi:dolichol-phosphate mannosyltransferase
MLSELAERDPRIRVIRFSRNFGYQKSIFTGYMAATGDAIIQLDCDMEDPPELCRTLIDGWQQGYDVVYGIRKGRQESWWRTLQRKLFYRIIDLISKDHLPHDAGDFRLIDRRVADVLAKYRDNSPYLRGTLAVIGFRQKGVEYCRDKRTAGESKFSFSANMALALDGIMNHSTLPLRMAGILGVILTLLVFLAGVGYFILKMVDPTLPVGFATQILLLLASIGINAIMLGIIGEYLGRLYREVKSGPISIIDRVCNLSKDEVTAIEKKLSSR